MSTGRQLTFGSLFAGIGGMDLGLERAGMICKWQVEIDLYCTRVLEKHWPNVKRYGDIKGITGHELERVDVICGGFPCQPFSSASAGKRKGKEDDRYLWPDMLRIIQVVKPSWVLGENVTHIDGPALETVVSDLETSGYEVAPPLEVPACAFGHDHKRSRLWFLGYSDSHSQPVMPVDAEMAGLPFGNSNAQRMGATNGLSKRLDTYRLGALGNAVVPDIPEWIGRHIIAASELRIPVCPATAQSEARVM